MNFWLDKHPRLWQLGAGIEVDRGWWAQVNLGPYTITAAKR